METKQQKHKVDILGIGKKWHIKRSSTNDAMRTMVKLGTDTLGVQFEHAGGKQAWWTYTSHPKHPGYVAGVMKKISESETGTTHSAGKIFYHDIRKHPKVKAKQVKEGSAQYVNLVSKYGATD